MPLEQSRLDEFIHFFWMDIQKSNPAAMVSICITKYNCPCSSTKTAKNKTLQGAEHASNGFLRLCVA